MSLPATWFPLPHVGTARDQRPDPAACADPQIRILLWGGQPGYRAVRTNDVPHLQCSHVQNVPPAPVASADAGAPYDRRARQRPIPSRKAPGQVPASQCPTAASAVPAALQSATGSNRAGLEAGSTPRHPQSLLCHAVKRADSPQRLLRSLAQAQQGTASTMLHYLRRRV
jgi:hypothetical protein